MIRVGEQRGGALAKLLVFLLLVAVVASAAIYVYGRRQQPLAIDRIVVATSDGRVTPSAIHLDDRIFVATVVRNNGRLPITLEGLDAESPVKDEPMTATAIALGDGTTPSSAAAFEATALDPGEGIGVVVTYDANPSFACRRQDETIQPLALAPLPLRFTTYGVEGTQSIDLTSEAPTIEVDPASCAAAKG